MSSYVPKSHDVTVLLYHLVFPAKCRRAVFDPAVDQALREVCLEIEARYQIKFLEIGTDKDHVHFLVQSVSTYSGTKLVTIIKSLTAREIFRRCPTVKRKLWGWGVLDRRLLREHGRPARQPADDWRRCQTARLHLPETSPGPPAGAVLIANTPPLAAGSFICNTI